MEDWATGPFEIADAGIGVHADNKNIAFAAGTFEIKNMSDVQRVKAAGGKGNAPAMTPGISELLAQHISRDDFGSGLAHKLGGGSGCLAAGGLQQVFARNGKRSAFADHQ